MKLAIKYLAVSALSRNPKNVRKHSPEQVEAICRSITEFGFTNPILVDPDHLIIAGHGRLEAAERLKLKEVPIITLSGLTDQQKRAYAIADNKIPLGATWDFDLLKEELAALEDLDVDLTLTGFDASELDLLLTESNALVAAVIAPVTPNPGQHPDLDKDDYEDQEEEPESDVAPAAVATEPKASDREYSKFELVMEHPNKLLLVETLNEVRQDRGYEKLEDALMHLIKAYNEGKMEA